METTEQVESGRLEMPAPALVGHSGGVSLGGRCSAAACGWEEWEGWDSMTHCSRRAELSPYFGFVFCFLCFCFASATDCSSGSGALASA